MFFTLANKLSLFRMILSPVFYVMITAEAPVYRQVSLVVFLVAALTDWYDGEIARRSGTVTNVGKFLDPLADKFLTSAAFIAFAVLHYVDWWMVAVIVARDIVITVLRSLAETRDMHIVTSKLAQAKTFSQMVVLYYLLLGIVAYDTRWITGRFSELLDSLMAPAVVLALMSVVTVLTLVTGVQYLVDNRTVIRACLPRFSRVSD